MLLSQITALQYYCRVLFLGRTLLKTVGAEKNLSKIISPDMYFEITRHVTALRQICLTLKRKILLHSHSIVLKQKCSFTDILTVQ